jgi:hypothetical protein
MALFRIVLALMALHGTSLVHGGREAASPESMELSIEPPQGRLAFTEKAR